MQNITRNSELRQTEFVFGKVFAFVLSFAAVDDDDVKETAFVDGVLYSAAEIKSKTFQYEFQFCRQTKGMAFGEWRAVRNRYNYVRRMRLVSIALQFKMNKEHFRRRNENGFCSLPYQLFRNHFHLKFFVRIARRIGFCLSKTKSDAMQL